MNLQWFNRNIKYVALHYINVHEIQDTLLKENRKKEGKMLYGFSILYTNTLLLYFQGNSLKPLDYIKIRKVSTNWGQVKVINVCILSHKWLLNSNRYEATIIHIKEIKLFKIYYH